MNRKLVACSALVWGGISFGRPISVPPPLPGPSLPGQNEIKMETYWLAPYVRVSEGFAGTLVTWFSKDGHVKRQIAVSSIEPGFVIIPGSTGHGKTILGVQNS